MKMKKNFLHAVPALLAVAALLSACAQPNVPIYTFSPNDVPTQPGTSKTSSTPAVGMPSSPANQYIERNITVTDQNSIFSIGIPPGNVENTEVIAEKPIDYWFEYLPAEIKLEVDGKEIARDLLKWETKIAYTKSVNRFSYRITNAATQAISYNLHLVPSSPGASIAVKVRQRWATQ
jgi:hypothetical protein